MHTFRDLKSDEWREFLGVSTFRHGRQHPLDVKVTQPDHPIMKGFPSSWITANEELYRIEKVWPGTTILAEAKAEDGNKKVNNGVFWVHPYGEKGKVFGTTIAHNNKTMADGDLPRPLHPRTPLGHQQARRRWQALGGLRTHHHSQGGTEATVGLRTARTGDWRTGDLEDWRTGGLEDWPTGGTGRHRSTASPESLQS